jgi:hypothetical protein
VRVDLFQKTVSDFKKLMEELEIKDLTVETFWSIYIPLSLWLYRRKLAKRPQEAYMVGFYGGIGIGKTTRTKILTMVLSELLKEKNEKDSYDSLVFVDIDDNGKERASENKVLDENRNTFNLINQEELLILDQNKQKNNTNILSKIEFLNRLSEVLQSFFRRDKVSSMFLQNDTQQSLIKTFLENKDNSNQNLIKMMTELDSMKINYSTVDYRRFSNELSSIINIKPENFKKVEKILRNLDKGLAAKNIEDIQSNLNKLSLFIDRSRKDEIKTNINLESKKDDRKEIEKNQVKLTDLTTNRLFFDGYGGQDADNNMSSMKKVKFDSAVQTDSPNVNQKENEKK